MDPESGTEHTRVEIDIRRFDGQSDRASLREYRRLKYVVFAVEQGWPIPSNDEQDEASEDEFDDCSEFVGAIDRKGVLVGVTRVTVSAELLPHLDLYSAHLERLSRLQSSPRLVGTVTALCVERRYRGVKGLTANGETIGKSLVIESLRLLHERNADVVFLSAVPGPSAFLCSRCGLFLIDPPVRYASPQGVILNMANDMSLLSSAAGRETGRARDRIAYFASRQKHATSTTPLSMLLAG